MTDMQSTRWYVVQTQINSEAKAELNLRRQGFDIYLPRCLKRRRHARKVEITARPLFPRYLFVAIDRTAQRWRSIQSTFGVARLISQGGEPASVPDGVVNAIKAREDDNGYVVLNLHHAFALGDKVRVLEGAFIDSAGLFDGRADRDRVAILLEMLGRKVRVLLDADLVVAV